MTGIIYTINIIQKEDNFTQQLYCRSTVYLLFQSEAIFAEVIVYLKMQDDVI
jgi:hypothetical protein